MHFTCLNRLFIAANHGRNRGLDVVNELPFKNAVVIARHRFDDRSASDNFVLLILPF